MDFRLFSTTNPLQIPSRLDLVLHKVLPTTPTKVALSYDLRITEFLNMQFSARQVDVQAVSRAIDILGAIAPPGRFLVVLRTALSQDNPGIRSKSAFALARHTDNVAMLQKLVGDSDARVRANTIEAMWGRTIPEAAVVFRKALGDANHRVAINAAYALYLIDPAKHLSDVEAFVNHAHPGYRTAAAWLIRKIGDSRHLFLLKTLVRDKSPDVRRAAFRTLAALRSVTADVP